jgi:MFS family permease
VAAGVGGGGGRAGDDSGSATFYHVPASKVPLYGLAFSIGNLAGPLILGPLFDSWGRKQMISLTYILSGVLLAWSAVLFDAGVLTAATQSLMWVVIFFFASAGASSAYLTVSETWPIEIRWRQSRCSSRSPASSGRSARSSTAP